MLKSFIVLLNIKYSKNLINKRSILRRQGSRRKEKFDCKKLKWSWKCQKGLIHNHLSKFERN